MVYTTHLWWVWGWFNIVLTSLCIFSGRTNYVTASKSLDYFMIYSLEFGEHAGDDFWTFHAT